MKTLDTGKDYAFAFQGIDPEKGHQMIYLGGDAWKGVHPEKGEKTMESQKMTAAAMEYINRPNSTMGSLG